MKDPAIRSAELLEDVFESSAPVSGGDLSTVIRVRLASGRSAIVKSDPKALAEAEMLRAIKASGAPAPDVLAVDGDLLVLADLGENNGLGNAWGALGRAVRTLHAATSEVYGWHIDHSFGAVAIPNAPSSRWPEFWAERRLMAGVETLPPELARRLEALCRSLPDRLPATPRPALLHGDLWSGNVIARDGDVCGLIDPVSYYGHNEVDLAMLCLFGRPDATFWDEYGQIDAGLVERRPIYQLWPALVHLRLFGSGYRGMVERLLDAAGV